MASPFLKKLPLAAGALLGACAVCCAPLALPFLVGITGVTALGTGYWFLGAGLLLALLVIAKSRHRKPGDCSPGCGCGSKP